MSTELVRVRTQYERHRDNELYRLYFTAIGMVDTPMGNPSYEMLKGELPNESELEIAVEDIYIINSNDEILTASNVGLKVDIMGTSTETVKFRDQYGFEEVDLEITVSAYLDEKGHYISWTYPVDPTYVVVGTEVSYNTVMKVN